MSSERWMQGHLWTRGRMSGSHGYKTESTDRQIHRTAQRFTCDRPPKSCMRYGYVHGKQPLEFCSAFDIVLHAWVGAIAIGTKPNENMTSGLFIVESHLCLSTKDGCEQLWRLTISVSVSSQARRPTKMVSDQQAPPISITTIITRCTQGHGPQNPLLNEITIY